MKTIKCTLTGTASALLITLFFLGFSSCSKDNIGPGDNTSPKDSTLTISSLSATTLHYGDTLIITGHNFSVTAANNLVTINGVSATVPSATDEQVKAIVPAVGATAGEVKIKTGNQTATGGPIVYVPDVFVAGSQNNGAGPLATYWKNGTPVTLSTQESVLTSIVLSGDDVYVAGSERTQNLQLANYWKNGIKNTLGTNGSSANAISVNGSNVYVGGFEIIDGFDLPRYWENGAGTTIAVNDPIISKIVTGNGACSGVFVNGGNVYAVGSYRNSQGRISPFEFKNGLIPANTVPNNDKHCYANAVFVNGSDEYVAGTQNSASTGLPMVTLWKNDIAVTLTDGTSSVGVATAVFATGADVYVAGYEQEDYYGGGPSFAKYWKNGEVVKLSTVSSAATGIAVFGGDVYVSGWETNGTYNVAKYWKNGVPVTVGETVLTSSGNAIVVR